MSLDRDSINRVLRTFVIAFVAIAVPGLLGWLHSLTTWANDGGQSAFPDAKSLAFLGITAVVAGCVAILNLVVVGLENYSGKALGREVPPK